MEEEWHIFTCGKKYIMTAREYQNDLLPLIGAKFPHQEIRNEWAAFTGQIHQYSPRVDIAVGPFNVAPGPNLTDTYNQLTADDTTIHFLTAAFQFHQQNLDIALYNEIVYPQFNHLISKNQNARCFLAFEIENKNSKKHIMGSVVNAASLGRVGIGIAFNQSTLRTFCKILNYLSFLRRVEKNSYDTTNFIVLSMEQVKQLLD